MDFDFDFKIKSFKDMAVLELLMWNGRSKYLPSSFSQSFILLVTFVSEPNHVLAVQTFSKPFGADYQNPLLFAKKI